MHCRYKRLFFGSCNYFDCYYTENFHSSILLCNKILCTIIKSNNSCEMSDYECEEKIRTKTGGPRPIAETWRTWQNDCVKQENITICSCKTLNGIYLDIFTVIFIIHALRECVRLMHSIKWKIKLTWFPFCHGHKVRRNMPSQRIRFKILLSF